MAAKQNDTLQINTTKTDNNKTSQKMSATPSSDEPPRRRKRSREVMLIESMRHMGEDGELAVACVTHCRYGEDVRHEWKECLERCVENALMRSPFMSMLPEEHHDAPAMESDVPQGLEVPSAEQL